MWPSLGSLGLGADTLLHQHARSSQHARFTHRTPVALPPVSCRPCHQINRLAAPYTEPYRRERNRLAARRSRTRRAQRQAEVLETLETVTGRLDAVNRELAAAQYAAAREAAAHARLRAAVGAWVQASGGTGGACAAAAAAGCGVAREMLEAAGYRGSAAAASAAGDSGTSQPQAMPVAGLCTTGLVSPFAAEARFAEASAPGGGAAHTAQQPLFAPITPRAAAQHPATAAINSGQDALQDAAAGTLAAVPALAGSLCATSALLLRDPLAAACGLGAVGPVTTGVPPFLRPCADDLGLRSRMAALMASAESLLAAQRQAQQAADDDSDDMDGDLAARGTDGSGGMAGQHLPVPEAVAAAAAAESWLMHNGSSSSGPPPSASGAFTPPCVGGSSTTTANGGGGGASPLPGPPLLLQQPLGAALAAALSLPLPGGAAVPASGGLLGPAPTAGAQSAAVAVCGAEAAAARVSRAAAKTTVEETEAVAMTARAGASMAVPGLFVGGAASPPLPTQLLPLPAPLGFSMRLDSRTLSLPLQLPGELLAINAEHNTTLDGLPRGPASAAASVPPSSPPALLQPLLPRQLPLQLPPPPAGEQALAEAADGAVDVFVAAAAEPPLLPPLQKYGSGRSSVSSISPGRRRV